MKLLRCPPRDPHKDAIFTLISEHRVAHTAKKEHTHRAGYDRLASAEAELTAKLVDTAPNTLGGAVTLVDCVFDLIVENKEYFSRRDLHLFICSIQATLRMLAFQTGEGDVLERQHPATKFVVN